MTAPLSAFVVRYHTILGLPPSSTWRLADALAQDVTPTANALASAERLMARGRRPEGTLGWTYAWDGGEAIFTATVMESGDCVPTP